MPSPKCRAKVQKCWMLRVTDTKLLSCSSALQWWCGPDLLQGDLSPAPSRCKALRHRSYGAPSSRQGQSITCTSQSNYNTLVHSSPRLYWARLKNSSASRFVANCLLGGYVFHHLSRLPSRFFTLPFSRILYSYSFPHLSLLSGCPFFPFPALPEGSDLVAPALCLWFRMWPVS